MFDKILVAIDGSKMSDKAVEMAKQLGNGQQSEITLLHVGKELVIPPNAIVLEYVTLLEEVKKNGIELLNNAKDLLDKEGLKVSVVYKVGDPARQIVDFAKKEHYDLIIIGSRGLGNFKELMLGSVSHKVSQLSHCPVMIVK